MIEQPTIKIAQDESKLSTAKTAIKENDVGVINEMITSLDDQRSNHHIAWLLSQYPNKDFLLHARETGDYSFSSYAKEKNYSTLINLDRLDDDWIAWTAATLNYRDIVDLMIARGVTSFDMIASSAAEYGHKDIVDDMIEKGADNYDEIAYFAACNGHTLIALTMVSLDPDHNEWIQWAIDGATTGKQENL